MELDETLGPNPKAYSPAHLSENTQMLVAVKTITLLAGEEAFIPKELIINEVTVKAKLLPIPGKADTVTLKIAPITMTDVGKKDKVNTAALISKVLTAIAKGIAEQGKDILPTEMIGPLGDTLKEAGQQLLEGGKGVLKEGTDLGKDIGGVIQGLFKKKEDE